MTVNGYNFSLPNATDFGVSEGECLVGIRPEAVSLKETGEGHQQCNIKVQFT